MRQELFVDAVEVFFEAYLKELGYSNQGGENYLRFREIQQKLWEIFLEKQKSGMEVGNVWQQFFGDWRILPEKARWFNSVMRNVGHATSSPGIRKAMEEYYRSEKYLTDYKNLDRKYGKEAKRLPEFRRYESGLSEEEKGEALAKLAELFPETRLIDLGWIFGRVMRSDLQVMFEINGKNNEENFVLERLLRKRCEEWGVVRHSDKLAIWRFWSCRKKEFVVDSLNRAVSVDLWPQVVDMEDLEKAKAAMVGVDERDELEVRMVKRWDGVVGIFSTIGYLL